MGRAVRVLIVDDSALVRQVLSELLSQDPTLEVVGTAADPLIAREKIRTLRPDVLTLDVEMPRMDGLAFLEELMRIQPMPVVMVSAVTTAGCEATLRALELGAVDFITKPRLDLRERLPEVAREVIEKVKGAARARPRRLALPPPPPVRANRPFAFRTTDRLIAVGASTGGTEALRVFLAALPPDSPGVVVVQHMPERFTRAFAERLDRLCAVRVKEAGEGDRVLAGHVLVAPGSHHLRVIRDGATFVVRLGGDPPVNHHRPSVDVLFESCAEAAGPNAVGVIMTGMGEDGARGLLALRRAGGRTLAQDEVTSVVFGMPRAAIALGAAERVLPLERLAAEALRLATSADPGRERPDAAGVG
ncbi:MAG: chemotaxis response regulator protein-glutamate methylesterase [Armatimonadota bacterium]|nr:chemotaxis response regulator protein-glutamate methylesterase [Armatimonadota bacterium]MDR7553909.1 chemotaxis response regulator protein-glutamate methylesterase [Armatimonadota bacterium]MDR7574107.1 chemotaxis response regulator protein-glutamate methylesterase [Armatimonadota bacterium]